MALLCPTEELQKYYHLYKGQDPPANKWLPSICGALGGLLGLAAMYINVPDFPAADPLTALAVGIVSGLAATGADQVIKQIGKGN